MSSPTRSTLNVGLWLLGAGLMGLFLAKKAKGQTPPIPVPTPAPVPPAPASTDLTRLFSVNGHSYRFLRRGDGYYDVELLSSQGVVAAYHYGPEGLEDLEGDPDQIAVIARDMPSFPKDIPEFQSDSNVAPPSDSVVDYAPLD